MSKNKFLEDNDTIQYKKNLAQLMAELNPKPSVALLEQLKQKYLSMRVRNDRN